MENNANKIKIYSIRLTTIMADFLTTQADKMGLLPSEYLRYLIHKEMDKTN